MSHQTWSLQKKLFAVIGTMGVVSMALLVVLSFLSSKAIREGNEQLIESTAVGVMDKIDRNLFERYGDVQAFALSEPARSGDPKRIADFISDMMVTYAPIYDLMIVVDPKGKVIAVNQVDKTGKPISSDSLIGKDYSGEEWFKAAISGKIKAGTSFVEDLHIDKDVQSILNNTGRVMNFTAPIRNSNGEITGVWTNRVSWPDVVEAIAKEESEKIKSDSIQTVFTYIVDKNGIYMLHPLADEFILKKKMNDFAALDKAKSVVRHLDVTVGDFSEPAIEASAPSRGYSIYPSQEWQAIMQIPQANPDAFMNLVIIAISIALMGACIFMAYAVIHRSTAMLSEVNTRLNVEASGMRQTAVTISKSSQSLANATTQQASALQETAASVEEINAMVKKSSDNAERSRMVASSSQDVATKGKEAVESMIGAMQEIDNSNSEIVKQIEESNNRISEIIKVINEIGSKTKVINDIVFQTKLLSFNASVEAARAGEHGKGFAVVAEEVGNLAQMSGNAAKEISDMLSGGISRVESIIGETKTNVNRLIVTAKDKVEAGTNIAHQCGEILDQVVRNVSEVSAMISEITEANQEQTQGISEISKAMHQLDQVTYENASTSQQSAKSSETLSTQADSVFSMVSTLKAVVSGVSVSEAESGEEAGVQRAAA